MAPIVYKSDAIRSEKLIKRLVSSTTKTTLIEVKKDRFEDAIINAFKSLEATTSGKGVQPKQYYKQVCLNLGATEDQAMEGDAPCPYNGNIKNMRGLIRSWIEERSPCSRQHYFRGGNITNWKDGERPLLFINNKLGKMNEEFEWKPYGVDGKANSARGDGWIYHPIKAMQFKQPSLVVLQAAVSMYKKKGMQGRNRSRITKDTITHVFINPTRVISV
jgi:hypothetical protein